MHSGRCHLSGRRFLRLPHIGRDLTTARKTWLIPINQAEKVFRSTNVLSKGEHSVIS